MRPFAWLWRQVCRLYAWIRDELRAMTVRGTFRWYWHHFLRGVCFHMPLILLLIALLVLPFNVFGEGLGVVQLIWHERLEHRLSVGAAFAMVALQALFVSYLLWDRARVGRLLQSDPGPLSFTRFAVYTVVSLV